MEQRTTKARGEVIYTRLDKHTHELAKRAAHVRYMNQANGMKSDTLSEYIRSLLYEDINALYEEIKSRRSF